MNNKQARKLRKQAVITAQNTQTSVTSVYKCLKKMVKDGTITFDHGNTRK